MLAAALNEKVTVTGNGKRRQITKREAVIAQPVNKSAAAELRATKMLIDMLRDIEKRAEPAAAAKSPFSPTDENLYLLHVLRKRMEYPELKRAVCEQRQAFEANDVLIEDKASGTQLIQELIEQGLHAVIRHQPQSDKIMRMHAQTAMLENGFVHLPKKRPGLPNMFTN